jgi:signal recognition particle receptor subunit beta
MIKWYYDNAHVLDRGGFTSVENDLGQTIYFDYASLSAEASFIYDVFAVGGSDECARERKVLTDGADGIIFVAHSEREKLESTLSSIDELVSILGDSYQNLPKVFALNKRDLLTEDLIEEGEFSELPDVQGNMVFVTVAKIGIGVSEAFQYLISDLAQRTQSLKEIPRAPAELAGIGVAALSIAEGFEASLEATYPEGFSIGVDEEKAIASVQSSGMTSPSFTTIRTGDFHICSYNTGKPDEQGVTRVVCLVLPSSVTRSDVYNLFERFYRSAPVILRYRRSGTPGEIPRILPQFYILARDMMISRAVSGSKHVTIRPRDLLRCKLLTEGTSEAIGNGVSYLSFLQNQLEYEILYSPSKTKSTYSSSVSLDEYETKTLLKEVERIQNNLSMRMKTTSEAGTRRKHVRTYLSEMRNTLGGIFKQIFNNAILDSLKEDDPEHLTMEVERQLFAIPLEILHDGQDYLCLRKPFSRWITGEQGLIEPEERHKPVPRVRGEGEPISILVVDSRLKKIPPVSPEDFGGRLIAFLRGKGSFGKLGVAVDAARGELRCEDVKALLSSSKYHVIQIISPAEISSGDPAGSSWVFSNGEIKGYELPELLAEGYPQMIISYVHSPSQEREWDSTQESRIIYSLASSALSAGTECFVGEVARQLDRSLFAMTTDLYREMLRNGKSVGESLRAARLNFIKANGVEDPDWMRPILYGNPAKHVSSVTHR